MRILLAAVVLSHISFCLVDAAIVDAGSLTSVTVEAPLYDSKLSDSNGCDPAGCVGDLTRVSTQRFLVRNFPVIPVLLCYRRGSLFRPSLRLESTSVPIRSPNKFKSTVSIYIYFYHRMAT